MSAIWPVAMHDRSRMPELQPDLETETVHAVERMTMHAAEVTLFGNAVPRPRGFAEAYDSVRCRRSCRRPGCSWRGGQGSDGRDLVVRGSAWRAGDLDVAQVDSGVETGREQCSNHAEYLCRSGHPGGYSPGW